jgi:hypothetical protein
METDSNVPSREKEIDFFNVTKHYGLKANIFSAVEFSAPYGKKNEMSAPKIMFSSWEDMLRGKITSKYLNKNMSIPHAS